LPLLPDRPPALAPPVPLAGAAAPPEPLGGDVTPPVAAGTDEPAAPPTPPLDVGGGVTWGELYSNAPTSVLPLVGSGTWRFKKSRVSVGISVPLSMAGLPETRS
jgi:hypothetical protein